MLVRHLIAPPWVSDVPALSESDKNIFGAISLKSSKLFGESVPIPNSPVSLNRATSVPDAENARLPPVGAYIPVLLYPKPLPVS